MTTEQGMFSFRLPRELLEAAREAARVEGMSTAAWIRGCVREGLYLGSSARLVIDAEDLDRPPAPEGWPTCRKCGCWEYDACWDEVDGGCWWVEEDLCSNCGEPEVVA